MTIKLNIKELVCPELMRGKYCMYLLQCSDLSFYCGSTHDLKNRINEHNLGEGAIWTKMRRPVKLVYFEIHDSLVSTRRREKQIKGWTVHKKMNLINGIWYKQIAKNARIELEQKTGKKVVSKNNLKLLEGRSGMEK